MGKSQNRLPGRNLPSKTIIAALDDILKEKYPNSERKTNVLSNNEIRIVIRFSDLSDLVFLILYKRNDQSVSITIRDNKSNESMIRANEIRSLLHARLDYGKALENNKTCYVSSANFEAIISFFDCNSSLERIIKKVEPEHIQIQYADTEDSSKLTIHYYPKKHLFLTQYGSAALESFVNASLQQVIGYTTDHEYTELMNSDDNYYNMIALEIKNSLGEELWQYIQHNHLALGSTVFSAFDTLNSTRMENQKTIQDYGFLVQTICRCYEGLMHTILINAGVEKQKKVVNYMYWDKGKKTYSLNYKYLNLSKKERDRLGDLYSMAYGNYRNDVSHGGPPATHFTIISYETAYSWFFNVIASMKESFTILAPYCGNKTTNLFPF